MSYTPPDLETEVVLESGYSPPDLWSTTLDAPLAPPSNRINGRGINTGPINGPRPVYVNGAATLPNGHSLVADGESVQLYQNASCLLEVGHALQSIANVKTPTVAAINTRAINSGRINGYDGQYVSLSASLVTVHGLSGDLTTPGEITASAQLLTDQTLSGDLTLGFETYVYGSAQLGQDHSLQGDFSFYYEVYVLGSSAMSHGHSLVGDFTYYQDYFVDGASTLPHGHTLSSNGQMVWLGSAATLHGHTLSGDLTLGFDTYVYANASLSQDHTLVADLLLFDPVDASAQVTQYHALNGALNLVPHVDIASTMVHGHSLEWDDSLSVFGSALLENRHLVVAKAVGGTPDLDSDPLWLSAEPLLDIEPRARSSRVAQEVSFTFDVTGFRYRVSGLNFCPLNGVELNSSCASFPEPDLSFTLDMQWAVGESQWSLDQEWEYVYDKDEFEWGLDQEWELDVGTQTIQQGQLDIEYTLLGGQWALDLLGLVNTARAAQNLIPVGLYLGPGEDIATTHSQNMADTEIFAHEDGGFPEGYQTVSQRITHVYELPTGYGENIAATISLDRHVRTVEELFDIWWNSPAHKANMLIDWSESDTPKMMIGYSMFYDWQDYAPDLWTTFYTQVFLGFGIPLGATLAQWQLGLTYQLDTVLITNLNVKYSLDAYTRVRAQHESSYGLNVSAQHSADYGAGVAAQHEAPIHFSVVTQHELGWTQAEPITVQFDASYDMDQYARVLQSIATLWGTNVSCQQVNLYSLNTSIKAQHEAGYEPSVTVQRQNEAKYDILTSNRVTAGHTAFWSMHTPSVTVTNSFATLTLKR